MKNDQERENKLKEAIKDALSTVCRKDENGVFYEEIYADYRDTLDDRTLKKICNDEGILKGRTAIRMFRKYPNLKTRPYWGNHFWADGYCVDTVGVNEEMIRMYVRYQEKQERRFEQERFKFD